MEKKKKKMKNLTIYIPDLYEDNLKKLIKLKRIPSRSGGIRLAIRDFLIKQYKELKILGYFDNTSKQEGNVKKRGNIKHQTEKIEWNSPEIEQLNKKLSENV